MACPCTFCDAFGLYSIFRCVAGNTCWNFKYVTVCSGLYLVNIGSSKSGTCLTCKFTGVECVIKIIDSIASLSNQAFTNGISMLIAIIITGWSDLFCSLCTICVCNRLVRKTDRSNLYISIVLICRHWFVCNIKYYCVSICRAMSVIIQILTHLFKSVTILVAIV